MITVKDLFERKMLSPYTPFRLVDKYGKELTPNISLCSNSEEDMDAEEKEMWEHIVPYLNKEITGISLDVECANHFIRLVIEL